MALQKTITITGTGASDSVDVGEPKTLTVATIGDDTDYVANVEVQLVDSGNWVTPAETISITDSTPFSTNGPVVGVRLNVSDMGSATTIAFEVVGAKQ